MRGAQTAEVPALHGALEALALVGARHVDELAGNEVVGGDLGAHFDEVVGDDPELDELALRLDLGDGEVLPLGLGEPRRLARAGTELQRGIAVLVVGAVSRATWTLSSFSTVTGMCSPASVKMRVMPTFCAITPERIRAFLPSLFRRRLATAAGPNCP